MSASAKVTGTIAAVGANTFAFAHGIPGGAVPATGGAEVILAHGTTANIDPDVTSVDNTNVVVSKTDAATATLHCHVTLGVRNTQF